MIEDLFETPITEDDALKKMARLCAKTEYSASDIRGKLRKMQVSDDRMEQIMNWLTANSYVDDARYAAHFIEQHVEIDRWGPRKIEAALRRKGIDEAIYRPLLEQFAPASYAETLLPMMRRKASTISKDKSPRDRRAALIRFGASKGFAMSDIMECLDRLDVPENDDDDETFPDE